MPELERWEHRKSQNLQKHNWGYNRSIHVEDCLKKWFSRVSMRLARGKVGVTGGLMQGLLSPA